MPGGGAATTLGRYKTIGWIVLIALATRLFVLQTYRMPSASMEDSILVGDYLLAFTLSYGPFIPATNIRLPGFGSPKSGDAVVVRFPHDTEREILKRCMAGPGQTVEIRNKILYLDGKRTVDPKKSKYIDPRVLPKESPDGVRDNYGPVTIPPGHYFVIGDNRDNSDDSRFWGFVQEHDIVAKPSLVYFSWEPDPESPVYEGPGSMPAILAYNVAHFFQLVRWDRIGTVIE
ncbi:MAG: signal peptidase I [Gemmatimonadetes bacterium]|nr:signal peptidase I [Gemmatimonadota bacterium]